MNEGQAELDLEVFGKLMDDFIKKCHVQMLVEMPEGTNDASLTDNIGAGPVVQLYILINAMGPVLAEMIGIDGILDPCKAADFLDGVLEMVKHDVLDAAYAERN